MKLNHGYVGSDRQTIEYINNFKLRLKSVKNTIVKTKMSCSQFDCNGSYLHFCLCVIFCRWITPKSSDRRDFHSPPHPPDVIVRIPVKVVSTQRNSLPLPRWCHQIIVSSFLNNSSEIMFLIFLSYLIPLSCAGYFIRW